MSSRRSGRTRVCPGLYARETAVGDIKDVDVLLLLHEDQLERTPNAVLLAVKKMLGDTPTRLWRLLASGARCISSSPFMICTWTLFRRWP